MNKFDEIREEKKQIMRNLRELKEKKHIEKDEDEEGGYSEIEYEKLDDQQIEDWAIRTLVRKNSRTGFGGSEYEYYLLKAIF